MAQLDPWSLDGDPAFRHCAPDGANALIRKDHMGDDDRITCVDEWVFEVQAKNWKLGEQHHDTVCRVVNKRLAQAFEDMESEFAKLGIDAEVSMYGHSE